MRFVKTFGAFWYDFVVGDDWRVAVGVVVTLGLTFLLAHQGVAMWWFVPLAVIGMMTMPLVRSKPPS